MARNYHAAFGRSHLLVAMILVSVFQGLQSLKDYHNIFCGKENCYDLLGVPQVSHVDLAGIGSVHLIRAQT